MFIMFPSFPSILLMLGLFKTLLILKNFTFSINIGFYVAFHPHMTLAGMLKLEFSPCSCMPPLTRQAEFIHRWKWTFLSDVMKFPTGVCEILL